MRRVVPIVAVAASLAAGGTLPLLRAADEKPKYTIKEVMKFHKEKLHEKYQKGEASKDDRQKLLDGYESMLKLKPPRGDEQAWKEKCEALIKAVKADDKNAYKKAVNCAACHKDHKPA